MNIIKEYKYLMIFVGLISIIQLLLTPITYDEAYYWVYSNFLSFGYYDHPPMVALLIAIGEVFGHGVFFTRICFLFMGMATIYLISEMVPKKFRLLSVVLFLTFPLLSASLVFALPDTPLLFFSVLFWYLTEKYIDKDSFKLSLLLSLTISALFYSKYHGLLIVLLTVLAEKKLFKRKSLYFIIAMTVVLYLPHLYWQYSNEFISFKFHLFGRREKHFDISNIFNYMIGALFVCGFIWPIYILIKTKALRVWNFRSIYFYNSIVFMIIIFFMSFRNQIELNWIVTASASFIIWVLRNIKDININHSLITLVPSITIMLIFRVLLINDLGLSNKIERLNELHGWKKRFEEFNQLELNKNIVFDNYQYGALFSYQFNEIYPVVHLRSRESQYTLLNLTKKYNIMDEDVISFVGTKNVFNSYRIETGYKDPVYVELNTSLKAIKEKYKK
jgi:hypothetical protein